MSTLADELLQDFEDSGSEGENDLIAAELLNHDGDNDDDDMMLDGDEEPDMDRDSEMDDTEDQAAARARARAKSGSLMDRLDPLLKDINHYQSKPMDLAAINFGNLEDNPEYKILIESNSLSTDVDEEMTKKHKYIRDHYSARFPELERYVQNPLAYSKVVAILGNGPWDSDSIRTIQDSTDNVVGESLKTVLDGPTLMNVTVEATTSKGQFIDQAELDRVSQACQEMIKLDSAKKTLTNYVQSRISIFAPNLTAVVGSLTAAQLINTAGGLKSLCLKPACNIPAWGIEKNRNTAFATNVSVRSQGYLYFSPIVRGIPDDLKKKAMKKVAAKLILAARADASHSSLDGSFGEEVRAQVLKALDKLTEPPPNKGQRALAAPDDKPSRKRGGRRARKAKEATAMTEIRKAQNRLAFGKEEKETDYGTGDSTVGLGMIGQNGDGRIRSMQVDNRTRAKLSQKNKGWGGATPIGGSASSLRGFGHAGGNIDLRGKGLRTSGVGSTIGGGAGTASSIAFTPVQGLELVDPKFQAELSRKRKAEEDRWFKGGTFTQVGGGSSSANGGSSFKAPEHPNKKVDTGAGKMGPPPSR
ncbi:pre-mRNA splicing factor [Xylariaceae sp. FL0255]|nr:pre-mRNA splicing factor [Xylariaceae sp. FL0255]